MKPSAKKQTPGRPVAPIGGRSETGMTELSGVMRERIACKAYELWRERGSRDGYAIQDWLDAEAMVMKERNP